MSTARMEYIKEKEQLIQSMNYGDFYEKTLDIKVNVFYSNYYDDISNLLTKIFSKHDNLTKFQTNNLYKIFDKFDYIRQCIDPNKLKDFDFAYSEDEELLLYRKTSKGLINIIINPGDCIAFSFIPFFEGNRNLYFIHNEDGDFEKLVFDFFMYD